MLPEITRVIAKMHDAGLVPDAWPEALKALTDVLGVAGAACIVSNKTTSRVDWVCFSGLSAEFQLEYINHYASLDPFSPLLKVGPGWTKLSECLPDSLLRKSEWYNDFVMACGVRDIFGARLVDTPSHSMLFGLHQQIGRSFGDRTVAIFANVERPLASAALRHLQHLVGPASGETGIEPVAGHTRYYFHVRNGRQYPDETGRVFSTHNEAIAYASVLAAELRQDRDWGGFVICVTDDGGGVVAEIPVRM
jgi:uncharacterized protein DUF6894